MVRIDCYTMRIITMKRTSVDMMVIDYVEIHFTQVYEYVI